MTKKKRTHVIKYQDSLTEQDLKDLMRKGCNNLFFESMGIDNRDIGLIQKMGFKWENLSDYCSSSVAEWCFYALHKLNREAGVRRELKGQTAVVIGSAGNIGGKVMDIAKGYGMNCFGYDEKYPSHTKKRLNKLLEIAEILFITIPSAYWDGEKMVRNDGYFDRAKFMMLKRKPVIINPARIGLIDLDLAMEMLDEGIISAYALDEWPNHRISVYTKCLFTTHNAWQTKEARARRMEQVSRKRKR